MQTTLGDKFEIQTMFFFSSHQENTPFYLFLNETIDNHRFE